MSKDALEDLAAALHRAANAVERLAGLPRGAGGADPISEPRPEPGLVYALRPDDGETLKQYAARLDRLPASAEVRAAKVALARDLYAQTWPDANQPYATTVADWLAATDGSIEDVVEQIGYTARAVKPKSPLAYLRVAFDQRRKPQRAPENDYPIPDMGNGSEATLRPSGRVLGGSPGGSPGPDQGVLSEPSAEYLEKQRKLKEALKRKGHLVGMPEYLDPDVRAQLEAGLEAEGGQE